MGMRPTAGTDHRRRALHLSYFTLGYNILEGAVSILAGWLAGSIALVGFGLDSFAESASGLIMVWRFGRHAKARGADEERVEKKAVRLVGCAFLVLAAYVLFESARKLAYGERPDPSLFGIAIAGVSLVVMPLLFFAKHSLGKRMGSRSLVADSKQTLGCIFLSAALLAGLGANYLFGLWQADPVIGLVIAAFFVKEGLAAIRDGELCTCCA